MKLKSFLIRKWVNRNLTSNIPSHTNKRRFLIVSTTGVGDSLWGEPAIRELKKQFPDAHLALLTSPLGYETLKNCSEINKFFIFRKGIRGFINLPRLITHLRQNAYDTAIIFHCSDSFIVPLCKIIGAQTIRGITRHAKDFADLLTEPFSFIKGEHPIDQRLQLAHIHTAKLEDKFLSLNVLNSEKQKIDDYLNSALLEQTCLIGFQVGANLPYKQWPKSYFIELGKKLADTFSCHIIVMGNSKEKQLAQEIANAIPRSICTAGRFALRESIALIQKLHILISNDTGPMHIGLALKVPTVALFAPTSSSLCGPHLQTNRVEIVENQKTCKQCVLHHCHHSFCMAQNTVSQVYKKIELLLSRFYPEIKNS